MNTSRMALAAFCAFVAYFVLGGVALTVLRIRTEFMKYPAVCRPQDGIKKVMPAGMAAMLYQGGSGTAEGARFGALIGVFSVRAFVIHNYVNLNIGLKLTIQQSVAYFVKWLVVGVVIGLIYRPAR